uniref:Uncharacterized protein n=1 Tax=Tanacetum cinerariifolium TaxID=118510 RepID=A0A699KT37_TANCI|nr:hypothetical protein [Tanacetum cinerariifolium]
MDQNSSLGKICLGDDVVAILSDKVEGSGDWNSPEYQDMAISKGKKVVNTLSFYRMETDEISERYIAPCFVTALEGYDGDDVVAISSDKVEGSGDWNSPEYQDMAISKGKKAVHTLSFYRMETDEISERYIAPCFVNALEGYDGEVNLEFDENLISNEFAVKLCLEYKEDDYEPGVILGRSFLRLAHGVVNFGNGVITIYSEPDLFEDDYKKTGKSLDD